MEDQNSKFLTTVPNMVNETPSIHLMAFLFKTHFSSLLKSFHFRIILLVLIE